MSLIDISYFVGDITIPNTDQVPVAERVNWYIGKYEQEFLRKILGYALYKAFIADLNVTAPATPSQRMLDILYGKEYTNLQGYLTQWRGLIMTDNPVFNMAGGYVYKPPITITGGSTPGFSSGVSAVIFNGMNGTPNWRGWDPIFFRGAPMEKDVDYSWDKETGEWALLVNNDKVGLNEKFFVSFELRTDPIVSTDIMPNQSPIANYVYYWYRRAVATQDTGIGEVRTKAENADNQNPNQKMATAWNEMSCRVGEFVEFMDANSANDHSIYPEWLWNYRWDTIREFEYSNPIF